ncbi:DUF971 domain-containing protein [Stappia sp. GBMRC 2046]|uniref:DUF971 domain-containing protein n=1 Tax=Stappia sediminis TaxID=2692190 RepID=A0A7X3S9U8_9HYPH|nr:DUF971 domain-containing protein [Stappia sediminis]MXN67258.1 DUF971 domain-containing protein [Stappia sediminis]
MSDNKKPWPTELRLKKDRKVLTITFDDGQAHEYSAEYLRVCSPSAEVQGHSPSQRKTVPGKREVAIMQVEPVGNYAVKLHFDDLHNSGIYSWDYFIKLAEEREALWGGYLKELEDKGLSRDR